MRNKFINRVLAIVLTLVCVMTAVPTSVFAAESDIASVGAENRTVTFNTCADSKGNQIKVVKTIKFANGEAYAKGTSHYIMKTTDDKGNTVNAYCIEPGVHLYAGDLLSIGASKVWSSLNINVRNAINATIAFGSEGNYSNLKKSISTLTFGEAYVATQVIVWEFKDGVRNPNAPYALNKGKAGYIDAYCSGGNYTNIKKAYDKIIDSLAKFQLVPSFSSDDKGYSPTITLKANYNAETRQWVCESVEKYDANGVLSSFPELFGTFDVGNGKVTISRKGNTATISASNIYTDGTAKTLTIGVSKSGIPTTNANGKAAELVAYGASGDVQDVVSGYDIDPPNAYLKVNIDTSGSYTRDGRIQKCCYTETEFKDDNVNDGEGALSTSENVEGWYFYVEADINFVNAYGVESFILGPTDNLGFTQSLAEYVIENIDPDITHDIPQGLYFFWELGKLKDGADGTDLENDYYFPENWSPDNKYGDVNPTGTLRTYDTGGEGLGNVGYAPNFFKIPLRVFKVNEPNVSLANFFFTATNNTTGEVFLLRTTKGTGSAFVVGADGDINPQYAKYNTEDGVYDNFLPEGDYVLHEIGKIKHTDLLGSRDFENDYSIPEYFDNPVDVVFSVTSEGYKLAQDSGLDTIEVYFYNTVSSYIAIQKKDVDSGNAVEGAKYGIFATETAENPLEELVTDENGYARSINKYPTGTYLIKELEAPLFYEKDETVYTVEVVPTVNVDNIVLLEVVDPLIPTSIKLYKHETGNVNIPLKGAKFALYSDKECIKKVEEVTTGSDGYATFSPVRPGTFYLKELFAPMFYQKSDEVKEIVISKTTQQDNVVIVYADNPFITSKVMISKTDKDTGKALAGAIYGIFSNQSCTNLLEEVITNSEGIAISENDYEPGTVLYIQELEAPDTYELDTTVHKVTVEKAVYTNAYVRVDVTDTLIPLYIEVYKVDEKDKTPIEGAEFALYSDKECKTKALETLVTGTDGKARTTKAYAPGTFYLKETNAAPGYIKSDEITAVVLSPTSEKNKVITVERTNPKGETHIAIEKVDKDTKELLAGAVYGLYTDSACTVPSEELTTDENGYAESVKTYPAGTYYLRELVSPDTYELDETVHTVVVSNEEAVNGTLKGTVVRTTLEDEKSKAKIMIFKYNPNGNSNIGLPGAVYGLYSDESCKMILETLTTGADGSALTENSYKIGTTLYCKEIEAPEGYIYNDNLYTIIISKEEIEKSVEAVPNTVSVPSEDFVFQRVWNQIKQPYIKIIKKDSQTGRLLANAEFRLYNPENKWATMIYLTTNANGEAVTTSKYQPGQTLYLEEIAAPDNYLLDDKVHEVYVEYVENDGDYIVVEIENDPVITTTITISKTCQQTGLPVKGALYRLYSSNETGTDGAILSTHYVDMVQTDSNGIGTFNITAVPGTVYYIQEWSHGVPEGYNWNKQIYKVTVTEDMDVIPVTNPIKTGSVYLTKKNWNGTPLKGVQFEVYRASDDTKVQLYTIALSSSSNLYAYSSGTSASNTYTAVTSANGNLQLLSLPIGDYYLKEVSTVDGYMPYYGKIHFSVELENSSDSSAKTIYIDVPNHPPVTWNTGGEGIMPFYYSSLVALVLSAVILAVPTMKYARKYKKSH